mmetsp:Transcript_20059/g.28825  ORF Transcript_20059/g.28825 Transcript_20059/m.28825 type:complete len:257 (-) Transcript_20059:188-958(-)
MKSFHLFILLLQYILSHSEHDDDGTCKCTGCSIHDCNDALLSCKTLLDGRYISENCITNITSIACYEFQCSDDDDMEDECITWCHTLQCQLHSYTCESNIKKCYHENTLIEYNHTQLSMNDLIQDKQSECYIPHIIQSIGVILTVQCHQHIHTLRLTDNHLVVTSNGYQTAVSLQYGDTVYSYNKQVCSVVSVERETQPQKYFGLNCLQSEVIANGILTSTFEDLHFLPSWYMYIAGNIFGISRASRFGEFISQWY